MRVELGTYVEHDERAVFDRWNAGLVTQVLASQFMYKTETGETRVCLFRENWKPVSRQAYKGEIKTPAVWIDHQSRTCIVFKIDDGDVYYVPVSGEVIELIVCGESEFRNKRFLRPVKDYPVERAARLYVEYSRELGATDEALELLGQHTTLTPEEKEMARKTRENPPPKKKAAGKKSGGGKSTGERKPTAAGRFRELIAEHDGGKGANRRSKLTDDQIFAKVQKEFGLDDNKRSYVAWYRNDMVKKGLNPPKPHEKSEAQAKGRGRPAGKKKAAKK